MHVVSTPVRMQDRVVRIDPSCVAVDELRAQLGSRSEDAIMLCRSPENGKVTWWKVSGLEELARVIEAFIFYRDGANKRAYISPTVHIRFA